MQRELILAILEKARVEGLANSTWIVLRFFLTTTLDQFFNDVVKDSVLFAFSHTLHGERVERQELSKSKCKEADHHRPLIISLETLESHPVVFRAGTFLDETELDKEHCDVRDFIR